MTVRKRRKKNKLRGQRTHGKGDTKNKRGSGSRGGVGKAGSHKHKFTKYYGTFGTEKKKVIGKPRPKAVNLEELQTLIPEWEKEKKVERKGNTVIIDGKISGVGKILGKGSIDFPLFLKKIKASAKAAKKIENAKGKIDAFEEDIEEEEGEE